MEIENLIPFFKSGWLAMDKNNNWWWFRFKPTLSESSGVWFSDIQYLNSRFVCKLSDFMIIRPVESWATSLMEIKNDR